MNFILPETLPANDWRPIYQAPSDSSRTYETSSDSKNHFRYDYTVDRDTVSINPSDAKMISLQIRVISATNPNTKYYLDCFNETITTTESISTDFGTYMYFGYHDKPATMSGEVDTTALYTYFNDNNRMTTSQNKTTYDWILTKGWNILYENWENVTDNSDPNAVSTTYSYNCSTNHSFINIMGLKWMIS